MIKVMHAVSIMNRAGQETFIMNMYRNIDRSEIQFGFQCSVSGIGDFDEEIKVLGGEIYHLEENRCRIPFLKYINDIRIQYRFFKEHKDYEVYHIHTYHAFNTLHKFFRFFLKYMKIERLACSKMAAEWMYGEKEVARVKIINNGINAEEFVFQKEERLKKRKELGIDNNLVIGHIGRFMPQKNHKFLIDIFEQIVKKDNKAILLLIGVGELQNEIEEMVKQKRLIENVRFMGTRTDIRELLWAMDLFLFPSLYEGLSVVAIEAQAAGVPVLAADTLTKETKITDCMQFYSLKRSPKEWAEQVNIIIKRGHQKTLDSIRKAHYDMKENVSVMERIYLK